MRQDLLHLSVAAAIVASLFSAGKASAQRSEKDDNDQGNGQSVQLGPRPFYLVEKR